MKQILLSLGFIAISAISFGQWQTSGTSIFYNDGNVGIGTSTPNSILHILGDGPRIVAENTDGNFLRMGSGTDGAAMIFNEQGKLWIEARSDFNVGTPTLKGIVIQGNGNLGINTDNPSEKLEVNGNILVSDNNAIILTSPNGTEFKITVDDSGNLTTTEYTGIKANSTDIDVQVYPNPAKELINIRINDQKIINVDAEIYELTGKMIYMKNYKSNSFQINTSNLANGTYLLKLKDKEGKLLKTEKILK